MIVFAGFALIYMKQALTLDYLWAGLCLLAQYVLCFAMCYRKFEVLL
jgi:uncharacterized protein (DUF486 family)